MARLEAVLEYQINRKRIVESLTLVTNEPTCVVFTFPCGMITGMKAVIVEFSPVVASIDCTCKTPSLLRGEAVIAAKVTTIPSRTDIVPFCVLTTKAFPGFCTTFENSVTV